MFANESNITVEGPYHGGCLSCSQHNGLGGLIDWVPLLYLSVYSLGLSFDIPGGDCIYCFSSNVGVSVSVSYLAPVIFQQVAPIKELANVSSIVPLNQESFTCVIELVLRDIEYWVVKHHALLST